MGELTSRRWAQGQACRGFGTAIEDIKVIFALDIVYICLHNLLCLLLQLWLYGKSSKPPENLYRVLTGIKKSALFEKYLRKSSLSCLY